MINQLLDKSNGKIIDKIIDKSNGKTVYEAWKLLPMSGIPPLTLPKCKGVDLIDYKIYGNSEQSILPSEYQQVEYIESTGTQCIDTGFIPNQDTSVEMDFMLTALPTSNADSVAMYGEWRTTNVYASRIYADTLSYFYGSQVYASLVTVDLDTTNRHIMKSVKNELYYDNILIQTRTYEEFTGDQTLSLLAQHGTSSFSRIASAKIYGCKIWDNDVLVRDYIPCYRKLDNAVGLYDLVNGEFYKNAGTGTFLKGIPIEIESVGDVVNYFDVSKAENGTIATNTGLNVDYQTNRVRTDYIYLKAGTYCLSTVGASTDITFGGSCHKYSVKDDETSWLGAIENNSVISTGNRNYRTFTLDEDCYCRFVLLPRTGSSITNLSIDNINKYKPQIELGDIPTEYEPYGKYKIPVKVSGKNLIDINKVLVGYTLSSNGDIVTNSNYDVSEYIEVKPNTTYTLQKYNNYSSSGAATNSRCFGYDENKKQTSLLGEIPLYDVGMGTITFTTGSNDKYIRVSIRHTDTEFQLEKGTSATNYEPYKEPVTTNIYLNEPLRKIRNKTNSIDYYDYIDFGKQKEFRNVVVLDDTGTLTIEESYKGVVDNIGTDIELPNIPTHKGTTIIEVDTTIQPSNMEVQYYGKEVK